MLIKIKRDLGVLLVWWHYSWVPILKLCWLYRSSVLPEWVREIQIVKLRPSFPAWSTLVRRKLISLLILSDIKLQLAWGQTTTRWAFYFNSSSSSRLWMVMDWDALLPLDSKKGLKATKGLCCLNLLISCVSLSDDSPHIPSQEVSKAQRIVYCNSRGLVGSSSGWVSVCAPG